MTRETKVGLLVGMGIILLIGIVVSDHLSTVQDQQPASFSDLDRETFDSLTTRNDHALPSGIPLASPARQAMQQRTTTFPLSTETVQTQRITLPAQTPSRYTPQPIAPTYTTQTPARIQPSQIPNAQPPIQVQQPRRTQLQQPRRTQDMSEEQAVAQNTRTRPIPHMAVALTPSSNQTQTGLYHTVQTGDNLFKLALKYYNNGDDWKLIRDANPRKVYSSGTITLGTQLLIPSKMALSQQNAQQSRMPAIQREIVVKPGQTLSELAKKYLGNAADWDELLEANKDKLSRPELLRAGMTLRLPQKAIKRQQQASTNRAKVSKPTPTRLTRTTRTHTPYTVRSGDTLSSIAASKLGSAKKWYQLYHFNKATLTDPDNLTVGRSIKIPR